MKLIPSIFLVAGIALPNVSIAEICDYAPSALIGGGPAAAVGTGAGATAVAGAGMKAAGLYTLTHAVTGATMLGSTAAGASAAGTVGIMGGTGGLLGAIGAAVMAPVVIGGAAVVATGVAAYEGGCYFFGDTAKSPARPQAKKNPPKVAPKTPTR